MICLFDTYYISFIRLNSSVLNSFVYFLVSAFSVSSFFRCPTLSSLGFVSRNQFPLCVWSLPNLTWIYAYSNGYVGSIPADDFLIGPGLQFVNIARNRLTGTMSTSLKSHHFAQIDLSYNKIAGSVQFESNSTLIGTSAYSVEVNRLSGNLPSSELESIGQIDVLEGNMFQCSGHNGLPSNDPDYSLYSCGSDNYNISMITFFVVFSSVLFAFSLSWLMSRMNISSHVGSRRLAIIFEYVSSTYREYLSYMLLLFNEDFNTRCPQTAKFVRALYDFTKLSIALVVVDSVVSIGIYGGLKSNDPQLKYKTHVEEYSWLYSAAYFSGVGAALSIIFMYVISASILIAWSVKATLVDTANQTTKYVNFGERFRVIFINVSVVFGCCIVSMGIYIGYVALIVNLSANALTALQLFTGLVSYLWKHVLCPNLLSGTVRYFKLENSMLLPLGTFVSCFSTIIAPTIAVLGTDANCFRDVIVGMQPFTSSTVEYRCDRFYFRGCLKSKPVIVSTTVTPSFVYNNECYSSVIVNISPIFLYNSVFTLLVLLTFCILSTFPHSKIPKLSFTLGIPSILWPENFITLMTQSIVTVVTSNLLVVITFGVTAPPVAVAACCNIFVTVYFWRVMIGRYYVWATKNTGEEDSIEVRNRNEEIIRNMESNCSDVGSFLQKVTFNVLCVSAVFYAFVTVDQTFDRESSPLYLLLALCPLLVPVVYQWVVLPVVRRARRRKQMMDTGLASLTSDHPDNPMFGDQGIETLNQENQRGSYLEESNRL